MTNNLTLIKFNLNSSLFNYWLLINNMIEFEEIDQGSFFYDYHVFQNPEQKDLVRKSGK